MVPFSICYFIDILFYILRKWLLIKNLARILSLKSKLPGKCRRFYAINKSIKILKKNLIFQKFQLNWKIVKHFTGPKQLAALMKLFCVLTTHSPSDKILLRLWKKTFFTEIYRNILTFAFKVLQECSFGRQEMVECKCFFWHQTEACLLENFGKLKKVLAMLQDHIIFNVSWDS